MSPVCGDSSCPGWQQVSWSELEAVRSRASPTVECTWVTGVEVGVGVWVLVKHHFLLQ